ncbi:AFG3-like protein 2 [Mayamaea pseudoterrestris]|nr:AFG3-like protein 2 [Mayamaea pseudoterrestris]
MSSSNIIMKGLRRHFQGRSFATRVKPSAPSSLAAAYLTPSLSDLSSLWIKPPKPGTGFDNFLKKTLNKDGKSSSKNQGNNGGSGGGGGNDFDRMLHWLVGVAFAVFILGMAKDYRESTSDDPQSIGMIPREISWHEFLRLLQQQNVVKILVKGSDGDERQSARVYLRSNAKGLSSSDHGSLVSGAVPAPMPAATTAASSNASSYEQLRRSHQSSRNIETTHHENEPTTMDFGNGTESSSSSKMNTGIPSMVAMDVINRNNNNANYYRMPIGSIESFEHKLDEAQRALGRDPSQDVPVQYMSDSSLARELVGIVPGLLMAAVLFGMMRYASGGLGGAGGAGKGGMGGIFQIGKSTHKKIASEDVSINFGNVAGCEEAKKEVMEFVDFLKDSERFTKLGAKIPKGALLCGPPGTGKTLLAKAVAGEAGVPFYSISGSDFIEMFVGVGPSRVRDLFREARAHAPCIIFIDEIDAVGRQRGRGGVGGNDERENTLNQLLVEMDGFSPSTGVVVLAGTNRVDILDQALTRPGRFDRQIMVGLPDLQGRKEIFKVHLSGIKLADDVEDIAGRLAGLTPGFAGADIANICNEAAIVAARRKGETVTLDDFEKATDRIIGGLESNKIMSKEERSIVAHHEAGHAVAGWFLEHADPLLKVTIIPRSSGALGFAQYLPKEVFLRTQEQIMDIVCMTLAGRAAEEIFFGRVTTGASDDLKKVTRLVYSTIQVYGMNTRLGQLSFPKDPNAMWDDRPYSEKTAKAMDEEARAIVDEAFERIKTLLLEKKEDVAKVANLLLANETITHDDVLQLIGPRPFKADPAYAEFIQRKEKLRKDVKNDNETDLDEPTDVQGPLQPGLA